MQTVIILIHLMIVLAMVGLVLLQKSEGGGLGMGSGGGGFMSNRGTANVLSRSTAILAALFFATSLFLSMMASYDRKPKSVIDSGTTAPASGGVLDRLRGGPPQQPAPAAPATPSGPQVPRQ